MGGGKANKNGVWAENRPIRRVQPINLPNHMTQANHQLEKQLLNPYDICVRLPPIGYYRSQGILNCALRA